MARLGIDPVWNPTRVLRSGEGIIAFLYNRQAFRLQVSVSSCLFLWLLPKVSIIATGGNPEDLCVPWIEGTRQMKKGMEVPGC